MDCKLVFILVFAIDGSDQPHTLAALPPGKICGTFWVEGLTRELAWLLYFSDDKHSQFLVCVCVCVLNKHNSAQSQMYASSLWCTVITDSCSLIVSKGLYIRWYRGLL